MNQIYTTLSSNIVAGALGEDVRQPNKSPGSQEAIAGAVCSIVFEGDVEQMSAKANPIIVCVDGKIALRQAGVLNGVWQ